MVKVYFESGSHAELVAVFRNEEDYDACELSLIKHAHSAGMFVTESSDDGLDLVEMVKKYEEK